MRKEHAKPQWMKCHPQYNDDDYFWQHDFIKYVNYSYIQK